MSKITLTTIKKFIKDNKGKIFISTINRFNGMTDGIDPCKDKSFKSANQTEPKQLDYGRDNTLGIENAHFVFDSRDYFMAYIDTEFYGYEISNCIGNFILAIKLADNHILRSIKW